MDYPTGKPTIYINMLGEFSISFCDQNINDHGVQAKKPWRLLSYLITYRNRDIAMEDLVELFWNEENSNNPTGALKTLICRVRKLLRPLGCPPQSLVIQQRGSYSWNSEVDTIVDAERFEEVSARALDDQIAPQVQLASCLAALDLYKGDFLPKSSKESWVAPIHAHYRDLHGKVAHKAIQLFGRAGDNQRIIDICQKAVTIQPFDEEIHYNLIYSLYALGNQKAALNHYNRTVQMFYNEFAITPSERLKNLYKIIQDQEHGIQMDMGAIQESLQEEGGPLGAYLCEYAVFRDIYQLESRTIQRTGDPAHLCLLTISDLEGNMFRPPILVRAMNQLDLAIRGSLRRGDVYTRYSVSQYLVMLPSANHENCIKVVQRIIHNFKKGYSRKDVNITFSLQAFASGRKHAKEG